MALPDFKGHVFESTGVKIYRCIHCGLTAIERDRTYEFSLPTMLGSTDKDIDLTKNSSAPACVQKST